MRRDTTSGGDELNVLVLGGSMRTRWRQGEKMEQRNREDSQNKTTHYSGFSVYCNVQRRNGSAQIGTQSGINRRAAKRIDLRTVEGSNVERNGGGKTATSEVDSVRFRSNFAGYQFRALYSSHLWSVSHGVAASGNATNGRWKPDRSGRKPAEWTRRRTLGSPGERRKPRRRCRERSAIVHPTVFTAATTHDNTNDKRR